MEDRYIFAQGKRLRCGFTTGTCAQAAARAAAIGLFTGEIPQTAEVTIPDGTKLILPVEEAACGEEEQTGRPFAVCAVRKDAGDDIDVTDGMPVFAKVSILPKTDEAKTRHGKKNAGERDKNGESELIKIRGGIGIGRVTKPGLDQPVGEAAINSVPRRMIRAEVASVMEEVGEEVPLEVEIFLPDGEERAKKTMNERLGILGGLSILGTTGIVEPQSQRALIETIRAELSMRHAAGERELLITPGNYGMNFIGQTAGLSAEKAVKCSNFIGDTLDAAKEFGFRHVTLVGHIGKLVKLSGGMMNTHSMYGDCRMELLCACGVRAGVPQEILERILDCVTCDDALSILSGQNLLEPVMDRLGERILYHMNYRCRGEMGLRILVFSNVYGVLADIGKDAGPSETGDR